MGLIAFAILALLTIYIGWKREFFSLPSESRSWLFPIRLFHVIASFAIYLVVAVLVTPFIGKIVQKVLFENPTTPSSTLGLASWVNFISSLLILLGLTALLFVMPRIVRKNIWQQSREEPYLIRKDFTTALLAWVISFPLVVFVNQGIDWIITNIFHFPKLPEQLAVQFLKMTFGYPVLLILAILSIVVLAPLVEEILFRGFLQSFIRQHLGHKQAIFITSVLFAFFHYSPEQGIANLTIVISLFSSLYSWDLFMKKEVLYWHL